MKLKHFVIGTLSFLILGSMVPNVHAQETSSDRFVIHVTNPERDGLEVGKGILVSGTADLPAGYHLWVFARRVNFEGLWWPQNEARINSRTGDWRVYANLGGEQDIGWEFDLAIAAFDEDGHIRLRNYRQKGIDTGDWPAIRMPAAAAPPKIFQVIKVSHD